MGRYVLSRLLGLVPTFLGIILVSFAVLHLSPGKPVGAMTDFNVRISLEAQQKRIEHFGLDRPLHERFLRWLGRFARGDFGNSWKDDRPVMTKILEALPVTLGINALALLLILLIAVPIGVLSAARENSLFDHAATGFVFVGFALPSFWVALLLLDTLGVRAGLLPVTGLQSLGAERWTWGARLLDLARHLALPVGVAVFGGLAGICRYVRSQTLDVLGQDYIRTARAKGVPEGAILFRHALRNALLPLITVLGLSLPGLIGGSVILESIFAIPGMGRLFYDAVISRDQPVVMGILVLAAVLTLLGNFLADICYIWADPRIRYGSRP